MNNIEKQDSSELLQLVSFMIGKEEFAVDILSVQEINKMVQITKVPNTQEFIEGVINLRGRVIPIIDLRTRLGLDKKEYDKDTRIIIVELKNSTAGFIVDAVNEVIRIPLNVTEVPPELVAGIDSDFIKSVGKLDDRLLILIDLNKILSTSDTEKLQTVV